MVVLHILFNIFIIVLLNIFLKGQIDVRMKHEMEHILSAFHLDNSNLIVLNPKELEERDLVENTEESFYLQLYDLKGNIYLKSKNYKNGPIIEPEIYLFDEDYYFEDKAYDGIQYRVCYAYLKDQTNSQLYLVQLAAVDELFNAVVYKIMLLNLISFPFVLIFIVFLSLILVKKAFNPINEIIEIANRISASNLKERINYDTEEDQEIDNLKKTLNSLFERLEDQIDRIEHFTDNASHQLMTPLTAMQSELDFILKKKRSEEEYRESLAALKEQTIRLINIIKSLLILAKEEDLTSQNMNIFNISNLFEREIIPLYKDNENIKFEIDFNLYCKGNAEYVSMVIYNLIDNAIKYSPNDTPIWVKLKETKSYLKIEVEDFGIGIAKEETDRIFERFYRSDKIDKLGMKGFGLGLSLVKTIVDSLGGRVDVESELGKGTKFEVKLPKVKITEE
ncbi:MAG: sensor histidine kinase [Ignavibacteria bacterium]|nr:MAG: sensor histidine kinase [Ignavibacteria bacterium]